MFEAVHASEASFTGLYFSNQIQFGRAIYFKGKKLRTRVARMQIPGAN